MGGERTHALLSASSAKRWLNCPPSARLCEKFPDTESEAAREGTLAHDIAEAKLHKIFVESGMSEAVYKKLMNKFKKRELYNPEMERFTDEYVEYIQKIAYGYNAVPTIALEKRVDYSHIAPEGFGYTDCIILCGSDLHVVDFKYGKGILVSAKEEKAGHELAEGNPQMALYAIGAIQSYGMFYPIERVHFHIVQLRKKNFSTWDTTAAELKIWGKWAKEIAELAYKGEGSYKQGPWCDDNFCPAAGHCRCRAKENLQLEELRNQVSGEMPLPPLLSNTEVGEILGRAQYLAKWVKKLEGYALSTLVAGGEVPGWKIVEGRSSRTFENADDAMKKLQAAGYKKALLYHQVPLSVTEAEALVSKEDYAGVLAPCITKPKGKPALVPESDKRPAYQVKPSVEEAFGGGNTYKEEQS